MLELEKHVLKPVVVSRHAAVEIPAHQWADASPAILNIISATLSPIITIVRGITIMELWACWWIFGRLEFW